MKKLALSLLGVAALAISSNAMALDTTRIYNVSISRGGQGTPAGAIIFDFDSDVPFDPVSGNLGACEYAAEWVNYAGLPLTAQCFFAEQKMHGGLSCLANSLRGVPTVVVADTAYSECDGFDPFQQISMVRYIQLGENFAIGNYPIALQGVVQFDSALANHTIYGLTLLG